MNSTQISNRDTVIDSRDIIARIRELERDTDNEIASEDDAEELRVLRALQDEAGPYCEWADGATLIRDSYFVEYAQELAEDIGAIGHDLPWPACHIDWDAAADALKMDYTSVEFDGETYWVRS